MQSTQFKNPEFSRITRLLETNKVLGIELTLRKSTEIRFLIESIKEACAELPEQNREGVLQWFSEWERQFFEDCQPDSPLDEEQRNMADALAILRYNGIKYVRKKIIKKEEEEAPWLDFDKKIKKILAEIVPEQSPEKYLKTFKQNQIEEKFLLFKFSEIKTVFQELKNDYFRLANKYNHKLDLKLKKFHEKLLKVQEASEVKKLYQELDILTLNVKKLFQVTKKNLDNAKNLGDELEQQDLRLTENLNVSEKLINKI